MAKRINLDVDSYVCLDGYTTECLHTLPGDKYTSAINPLRWLTKYPDLRKISFTVYSVKHTDGTIIHRLIAAYHPVVDDESLPQLFWTARLREFQATGQKIELTIMYDTDKLIYYGYPVENKNGTFTVGKNKIMGNRITYAVEIGR